jgi:aldehyde dehydrogenase (NAD+)
MSEFDASGMVLSVRAAVGGGGFGRYHGHWGLDTFSHLRSVDRRPNWFKELPLFRPPYADSKLKLGRRLF